MAAATTDRRGLASFIIALALPPACLARGLTAATIHVPGDHPTIQAAIDASVHGDEIIVQPGEYPEFINFLGKAVTLRSTDPEDWSVVTQTIIGGGAGDGSIVTCNSGETPQTVLAGFSIAGGSCTESGAGMHIAFSSPTVSNCWFHDNIVDGWGGGGLFVDHGEVAVTDCMFSLNQCACSPGDADGGAVLNWGGTVSFTSCTFLDNHADGSGGALFSSEGGNATFTNCEFSSNSSGDHGGGADIVDGNASFDGCSFIGNTAGADGGGIRAHGEEQVSDCTFTDNTAALGGGMYAAGPVVTSNCAFTGNFASRGGGLHVTKNPTFPALDAEVLDCTFEANEAEFGGGAYLYWDDPASPLFAPTLAGCSFTANIALTTDGGGLYNENGSPTVADCSFIDNMAALCGGGACNASTALHITPLMLNCTFDTNFAGYGAGVMNINMDLSMPINEPAFVNCRFLANWAIMFGGGAYNLYGSNPTFTNCTFTENVGWTQGSFDGIGGILNTESVSTVANSIVWANVGGEIGNFDGGACIVRYSDVQGGHVGLGNIDVDPLFADPAGGDYRLSAGSPCIDAASNAAVPLGVDVDLDGNPRFVDDPDTPDTGVGDPPLVDMGAYEFQVGAGCPADVNGDGTVDVLDLLLILTAWDNTGGPEDINGDGVVDVLDLLELLAAWGPC